MVATVELIKKLLAHLGLFIINFCVLVGVIESTQLFTPDLPLLNALALGYMLVHTFSLLSIQLGLQVLELIKGRMPTFLISYYFLFGDEESIPVPLLDPTKSKFAVIILLLVISGGPLLYPIFAVYGWFLVFAYLVAIALDPRVIVGYFLLFLNWAPPLILFIIGIVILSIVVIEFKHR
jgi:hypothetical protein